MSFREFPFTPAAMGARSIDPRTFPRHEEASALAHELAVLCVYVSTRALVQETFGQLTFQFRIQ
jgi:hypothetical protein